MIRPQHIALIMLALLGLSACKTPTHIDDWLTRSPDLVTVNPNDIAVLPIEDASPGKQANAVVGFTGTTLFFMLVLLASLYMMLTGQVPDLPVEAPAAETVP